MTKPLSSQTVVDAVAAPAPVVLPVTFIPVNGYTTFRAEFAIMEGDLVFHFFRTPEVEARPDATRYWIEAFPRVLEPTAKTVFNAEYPRLKASYTEEVQSWWFRAYGFGMLLDPDALAYRFLDALDDALDKV